MKARRFEFAYAPKTTQEKTLLALVPQANGADYNHQDHRQHYCVFCDVLTAIVIPEIQEEVEHHNSFTDKFSGWPTARKSWEGYDLIRL